MNGWTSRDQDLIHALGSYGILSTPQIRQLLFQNNRKTTMLRRLRILEKRRLIRRTTGLPGGGFAWYLPPEVGEKAGFEGIPMHINRNSLEHDVFLSQVRIALNSIGVGDSWTNEFALRRRAWEQQKGQYAIQEAIPDAILTVDHNGLKVLALELELWGKSRRRYEKIFAGYNGKRQLWRILYLVPHKELGKLISEVKAKVAWKTNEIPVMWGIIEDILKHPKQALLHLADQSSTLERIINIPESKAS
ncbi:MAG: replication-relaxation family protein [Deltaproteobacteria bacterium]|nr:replication-relaxation family protein [Deltaproteobacteria bacterium]